MGPQVSRSSLHFWWPVCKNSWNLGEFLGRRKGSKPLQTHPCLRRRPEGNHNAHSKGYTGTFFEFAAVEGNHSLHYPAQLASVGHCQLKTRKKREMASQKTENMVSSFIFLLASLVVVFETDSEFDRKPGWKRFSVFPFIIFFTPKKIHLTYSALWNNLKPQSGKLG